MSTLDLEQAAEFLKMSPETLRKWAHARRIPSTKIGRRWVFTKELLTAFIRSRYGNQTTPARAERKSSVGMKELRRAAEALSRGMGPYEPLPERAPVEPKPGSFYAAKRKTAILQRTPAWADLAAILAVYAECERITRRTGIRHHVDHEIPLQGRLVSGLHVHNNLQILTAAENLRKHNGWPG